ncbi:MAG: hypothetical protein UE295_06815 [Acutalibacteraceae bacterium]|nr:hypothetical protein [Acutalibacteraceae bacterium]
MAKILSYICVFLCLVIFIYHQAYNKLTSKKNELEQDITEITQEKDLLKQQLSFIENEIEERNKNALEVSKRNEELEKLVATSKESCWSRIISSTDPILIRLRKD